MEMPAFSLCDNWTKGTRSLRLNGKLFPNVADTPAFFCYHTSASGLCFMVSNTQFSMEEITSGLGGQLWPAGLCMSVCVGGLGMQGCQFDSSDHLGTPWEAGVLREDEEHFSPFNTAAGVAICEVLWYWAAPTKPSCVGKTGHDVYQSGRFNRLHKWREL